MALRGGPGASEEQLKEEGCHEGRAVTSPTRSETERGLRPATAQRAGVAAGTAAALSPEGASAWWA